MTTMTKLLAAGALASAMSAGAAQAATLSLDATGGSVIALPSSYNPPAGTGAVIGDLVTNFSGLVFTGGLKVDGPATITFTFLGKEAGFTNSAMELVLGTGILSDAIVGASMSFVQLTAGIVNFKFATNGLGGASITNGVGSTNAFLDMAFKAIDADSYLAFFGDGGGNNDNDFDDMVVRIDVAAVPVPAAGFLLIGALGGLAAVRRRKTA